MITQKKEWWVIANEVHLNEVDLLTEIKQLFLEENFRSRSTKYNKLLSKYSNFIPAQKREFHNLGFETPKLQEADLQFLPPGSFFFYLPFTLRTPFISKDDEPFYFHENPVHKDWVLKVPMVSPTSWKGAFRAALRALLNKDDHDPQVIRLMGNSKGSDIDFSAGALHFFPTFFDRIGLEVINPQDRKRSTGTTPITIECVPMGGKGVFAILYVPFMQEAWKDDIQLVANAIYSLLVSRGFGGKTGSGMGRIESVFQARAYVLINIPQADQSSFHNRSITLANSSNLTSFWDLISTQSGA